MKGLLKNSTNDLQKVDALVFEIHGMKQLYNSITREGKASLYSKLIDDAIQRCFSN
jgi:hypothetical protein